MKKNKTNLILIFVIVLFIFSSFFFVYVLNVIKNKNKHISATTIALEKKIKEKENIDVLEKKIIELGDTHKTISGYLVNSSNIDKFVEYLERVGESNSIIISVKNVDVPKNEKNKILVNLNMEGNFSDIIKVIYILENSPYNISISSTYINKSIVSPDDKGNLNPKSNWQADISFSVLSF